MTGIATALTITYILKKQREDCYCTEPVQEQTETTGKKTMLVYNKVTIQK